MAGTKHTATTPGPWIRQTIDDDGGVSIVGADLGGLVGAALPWPTEIDSQDFSRVEANANLIAAAPDLLAACKAALATHGCEKSEPSLPTLREVEGMLRAAIAKAESSHA